MWDFSSYLSDTDFNLIPLVENIICIMSTL